MCKYLQNTFGDAVARHLLITTFGSLGDLHPYLALALQWQKRGGRATIATSELYRAKIEAENVGFFPVRPDLPAPENSAPMIERLMDTRHGTRRLFQELMMPSLRDSYHDLYAACVQTKPDIFLSHPITFAAPIVAEQLDLCWASSVLSPLSLWSHHDAPLLPGVEGANWARLHPILSRSLSFVAHHLTRSWFAPVEQLRRELKLSRGAHPLFGGVHSPQLLLALFSKTLARPQCDWPKPTRLCGFCFYDRHEEDATEMAQLESWLDEGAPPIVFTLGSAAVYTARDFWLHSRRAARRLNRRAVFLVGGGDAGNAFNVPLHANEYVAAYAPYSRLFSRAAVVVHQGGVGTTAQAMRAGVPQLVMPFSHDQPDNATRLQRMGVALTMQRASYNANSAAEMIRQLLSNSDYARRAQNISAQIRRENGPVTACDALEQLLANC